MKEDYNHWFFSLESGGRMVILYIFAWILFGIWGIFTIILG
jgi:hypothetical protein